eukprot:COSAG01_NODE_3429_length_6104_cov_67.418748_4_plen_385_part_00
MALCSAPVLTVCDRCYALRSTVTRRRSPPASILSIATPRALFDRQCLSLYSSPPACILVNLFWLNVFFSGDRRPAAIDLIRASFLLAEIDSRQHAAGQPPVHAAVWIRLKVPPQRTGDVRRSAARRCLLVWIRLKVPPQRTGDVPPLRRPPPLPCLLLLGPAWLLSAATLYVCCAGFLRACWPPDRRPRCASARPRWVVLMRGCGCVRAWVRVCLDKGFVKTWSDIRQEFGVTEERPKNILPLNAIAKNELVCRVTFDPSNSNDDEVLSVNQFADTLPKPTCIYPGCTTTAACRGRRGGACSPYTARRRCLPETSSPRPRLLAVGVSICRTALGSVVTAGGSFISHVILTARDHSAKMHTRRKHHRAGGWAVEWLAPLSGWRLT